MQNQHKEAKIVLILHCSGFLGAHMQDVSLSPQETELT
jgi:hypothetical protein